MKYIFFLLLLAISGAVYSQDSTLVKKDSVENCVILIGDYKPAEVEAKVYWDVYKMKNGSYKKYARKVVYFNGKEANITKIKSYKCG